MYCLITNKDTVCVSRGPIREVEPVSTETEMDMDMVMDMVMEMEIEMEEEGRWT